MRPILRGKGDGVFVLCMNRRDEARAGSGIRGFAKRASSGQAQGIAFAEGHFVDDNSHCLTFFFGNRIAFGPLIWHNMTTANAPDDRRKSPVTYASALAANNASIRKNKAAEAR